MKRLIQAFARAPRDFALATNTIPAICEGRSFSRNFQDACSTTPVVYSPPDDNPLWKYFLQNKKGKGIWKWRHYFDAYQRHFNRFVGQKINLLEIGVFSGGSMEMWRTYFGENCHIYGVDIEEACKAYESSQISILIGDQEDRQFWGMVKKSVPGVDILIDDGGHTVEQQQVTLEEMLPFLNPGGVYVCEDIHGDFKKFSAFASAFVHELNSLNEKETSFQSMIHSIHFYPYMLVIEKHFAPVRKMEQCKNGTEWQPFFDWMAKGNHKTV